MIAAWDNHIKNFIALCDKYNVDMILVGGGAVYFHGYQRHSADIDFWIDTEPSNLERLITVFQKMGYELDSFPRAVNEQEQNISIKFTPTSLNLELITRFSIKKEFKDVLKQSKKVEVFDEKVLRYNVLSFDDLITSKIKAGRPKDLLDIQELQRLNEK